MTDNPIDIPALIRDLSPDENVPPLQEHVIAALEQAQAEIMRLNGLVSFADSTITGLNDRDRYGRKQVMLARVERDDAREEANRLRSELVELLDLIDDDAEDDAPDWMHLAARSIRDSLAATPPAAEPAGQGDGVTSVWGDGLRFASPPATQQGDGWIAVEDEKPPEEADVLVAIPAWGGRKPGEFCPLMVLRYAMSSWQDHEGTWYGNEPTHWRPLPPPPATQQGEQQEARP